MGMHCSPLKFEGERESRDRERKKSWKEGQKGVRVRCRRKEGENTDGVKEGRRLRSGRTFPTGVLIARVSKL